MGSNSKQWRKDHPFGFSAKPIRSPATNTIDMKIWDCGVPGKAGTLWEGGLFKLNIIFPDGESLSCHLRYSYGFALIYNL